MIIRRWGSNQPSDRYIVNHSAQTLVTPPLQEVVTLDEVKTHLRVDFPDDDALISLMIVAARQRMEKWLRRALLTQTWDLVLDWGPAWIELPKPPLQSVVGIYVRQLDLTEYQVPVGPPSSYYVNAPARVVGLIPSAVWPVHITPWGFRVRYIAGYGDDPSAVPAAIKLTMYNMIGYAYEQRTTINEMAEADKSATRAYRIEGDPWRMAPGVEPPELLA